MLLVHAPAKLNLSLRVLGPRADGFHELDTLMVQLPGLTDELSFMPSDAFQFQCNDPTIPTDERNLVVKALKAYEVAAEVTCAWSISLKKNIPHGAGLGGGSSDAAQTLLTLNSLHDSRLSPEKIHQIAAALGSDIPFFLTQGAARCTGRGEKIEPLESPPAFKVLLLKPSFGVPTIDAYGRWKSSQEIPGVVYEAQSYREITFVNDLERPVFEKYRFLAEMKEWLRRREETHVSLMSGSGSTIFSIIHHDADPTELAAAACRELDPTLWHWSGFTHG